MDQYGVDNILGVTVGNEYLLQAASGTGGVATAQTYLISKIEEVRTMIAAKNYAKTIPVGTADAGSMITAALSQAADYVSIENLSFDKNSINNASPGYGKFSSVLLRDYY